MRHRNCNRPKRLGPRSRGRYSPHGFLPKNHPKNHRKNREALNIWQAMSKRRKFKDIGVPKYQPESTATCDWRSFPSRFTSKT